MESRTRRRARRLICSVLFSVSCLVPARGLAGPSDSFGAMESASRGPSKIDLQKYCTQRDQGRLGTCHAFALSCPIEMLENRGKSNRELAKSPYRVSENWLVFVSVLDRLCRDGRTLLTNRGYYPSLNAQRLKSIGYCSQDAYTQYDKWNKFRGTDPSKGGPATGGESIRVEGESDSEVMAMYEHFFGREERPGAAGSSAAGGPRVVYIPPAVVEAKFKKAFGISQRDARQAFCTGNIDKNVEALIKRGAVSEQFKTCFQEAREKKKKKLNQCEPKFFGGNMSAADKIAAIKEKLKSGEPVIISVRDYPSFTHAVAGHQYHAISLRGFDDENRRFLAQNSWGSRANWPIPYTRVNNIVGFGSLNCSRVQRRDLARHEEQGRRGGKPSAPPAGGGNDEHDTEIRVGP